MLVIIVHASLRSITVGVSVPKKGMVSETISAESSLDNAKHGPDVEHRRRSGSLELHRDHCFDSPRMCR